MEEFIIAVFCCVDDLLREISQIYPINRRGFTPQLADSEVITMEIVGEYQGLDADKAIWQSFHRHWLTLVPKLKVRCRFVRPAANLWQDKTVLQQRLAAPLGAFEEDIHLMEGLPMPRCCVTRASRCQTCQGTANYGYCAAQDEIDDGFQGHLLIRGPGGDHGIQADPCPWE